MKHLAKKTISLWILILIILAGCNLSPTGIFRSLEVESELDDGNLDNNLTIGSFIELGGSFYIAAGNVYTRSASSSNGWERLSPPHDGWLCQSIAVAGTTLLAVFFDPTGAESTLYSLNNNSFEEITTAPVRGKYCTNLVSIDRPSPDSTVVLLHCKESSYSYSVYVTTDGATFTQTTFSDKTNNLLNQTIDDGTYNSSESNIWIITGNAIYTSSDSGASFTIQSGPSGSLIYSGLHYATSIGALFVSSNNANLYGYINGSWGDAVSKSADDTENVDNFFGIVELNTADRVLLLVGTEEGYLESGMSTTEVPFNDTGDFSSINLVSPETNGFSASLNYVNTDLAQSVVNSFHVVRSDSEQILFALSANNGLWRNQSEDGQRVWNRE